MLQQQCSVDVQVRDRVALVAVLGELDLATSPLFVDRLTHLERTDVETIMLDLREVTFIDSSAIHALLIAHDHAQQHGHRLILVGANALVQRIIGLTGNQFLLHENGTVMGAAQFTRPESAALHHDPVVGPAA